ncbi:MAG: SDR family NAD(P)-dependent oxidoreductase [Alphaproteobacteria bacterium]|nr:SDR family NAD(P)-dependent oxidoreductase [Alphaproteobacteria bacterium]
MNLEGQTVWITGASSGIGEALAVAASAAGAAVILSGRREAELRRVADGLSGDSLVLPFDATDYDALPAIVARAEGWRGRVDMLVNNAGISQRSLGIETKFEVYRELMEVDFFAPLRLTQLVLPAMIARKGGHLVAISSVAGKAGSPLRTGYCAAKHAVVGYFDALRAEIAKYGVSVTVVTPGFVRTAIAKHALTADGSARGYSDENIDAGISPAEAAQQIMDGLAAGQREIPVGKAGSPEMLLLDLKRQNPDGLFDIMANMAKNL